MVILLMLKQNTVLIRLPRRLIIVINASIYLVINLNPEINCYYIILSLKLIHDKSCAFIIIIAVIKTKNIFKKKS